MLARIIGATVLILALGPGIVGQGKVVKEELPFTSSLGRTAIGLPEATDRGTWDGTWIYVSRDVRMALWLTRDKGKTIAKIQFQGTISGDEAFETDWTGTANYSVQDLPGIFEFTLKNDDPDRLEADWYWSLDLRGSSRTENADIQMYRAGNGRRMVMYFKDFERIVKSGGNTRRFALPQAWTFRKLSRRLALWEELPL